MRYLPTTPRFLFAGLAGLALLLVGCQATVPELGLLKSAKFHLGGMAEVVVKPEVVSERKLLAMAAPALQPKDVHHLVISLYRLQDDPLATEPIETEVASRSVANSTFGQDGLTLVEEDFTFNNLHADTEYRIRGFAYDAPGFSALDLISTVDDRSKVDFTTDNNDAPQAVGIPIQLKDTPFDAIADAGGINVSNGDYLPVGFVKTIAGHVPSPGPDVPSPGQPLPPPSPDPLQDYMASPTAVAINPADDAVWFADFGNHMVRGGYYDDTTGNFGTIFLQSGQAAVPGFELAQVNDYQAHFNNPSGLAFTDDGSLYIGDTGNNAIRFMTDGVVRTVAGLGPATPGVNNGAASTATFNHPTAVAFDERTDLLFIADTGNHVIRYYDEVSNQVQTVTGLPALFEPRGVAVYRDRLIVADSGNHCLRAIRFVKTPTGVTFSDVSLLAGSTQGQDNGPGVSARFNFPTGLAVDGNGTIYVADTGNSRIRRVTVRDGSVQVSAFAGTNPGRLNAVGPAAEFLAPRGLAIHPTDGQMFVADTENHRLRLID